MFEINIFDSIFSKLVFIEDMEDWAKSQINSFGKETSYENSNGFFMKKYYDSKGKYLYCESSEITKI